MSTSQSSRSVRALVRLWLAVSGHEATRSQLLQYHATALLTRAADRVEGDIGVQGRFVRVVHACEASDLSPASAGIQAFGIARLANLDGSVYIPFNETVPHHHAPHLLAGSTVG